MAIVNEARAVLTAEDRASAVLAMVARNFDRLNRAADRLDANGAGVRRQQVTQQAMSRTAAITERMGAVAARAAGPLAAVMGVYGAARFVNNANKEFAQNERAMTRIAVTADASAEAQRTAWGDLQKLAFDTAQPVDKVREGLEALVAAGRSLPDAMAFLPSVARTAQASGATTADIAKSADAVGSAFKIAGKDMQAAFDIMATGGKLGQFELKDMARYLPSLAPAAAAIGMEGKKGLTDLVAMLQIIRKGSGTAEEAAGSMNNILQKMSSEETTKKYKKLGVDLEGMFKKGKASGQDMISVFMEATQLATKGDLGKLPQLIGDMEFARGVRALMAFRGELDKMRQTIASTSAGAVAADLKRVMGDSQTTTDRLKGAYDRLADTLGSRLAPAYKAVADAAIGMADAATKALAPAEDEVSFRKRMNIPLTPEQQRAEYERMRKDREAALDNPSSDYYAMRDGGFGSGLSRMSPSRYAILKAKSKLTKAEIAEKEAFERRFQKEREAREKAGAGSSKTPWQLADRVAPEAYDGSTEADRIRADEMRRADAGRADQRLKEDALAGRGQPGQDVALAVFELARAERARLLTGSVPASAGNSRQNLWNALRDQAPKGPEGEIDMAGVKKAFDALIEGAKTLAAQPSKSPTGEYLDIQGVGKLLSTVLQQQGENKPSQAGAKAEPITAKADVDVTSSVKVEVIPTADFWAKVDARVTSQSSRDSRGISLPGKETRVGGGGMSP